jgi:geranylgeranyl diphosphate synthase type II
MKRMTGTEKYLDAINRSIEKVILIKEPVNLYEPIKYIVSLGGKRVRPTLTLMTCDILKKDYGHAIYASLALELFHNFSLIHDDIMDNAPLRRGKPTVHNKWDLNTGILSGDAMLILAYQLFENYSPPLFKELAMLFSKTALQVCEGQQYDIDFETSDQVSLEDYLKMIEFKTAVLLGAAMKMGAIISEESEECKNNLYEFGRNLGIAFQLQDDYLDAFGKMNSFGKQIGGDIISNKKTFLYLMAIKNGNQNQIENLKELYSKASFNPKQKIDKVITIFKANEADKAILNEIKKYTQTAFDHLRTLPISDEDKNKFQNFGEMLMNRRD